MRAFLAEIDAQVPVAYLGDDTTDEAAFQAMQDRGISVLVRPKWRQTAARFWLKPPAELLEFFDLWLKACAEGGILGAGAASAVNG